MPTGTRWVFEGTGVGMPFFFCWKNKSGGDVVTPDLNLGRQCSESACEQGEDLDPLMEFPFNLHRIHAWHRGTVDNVLSELP